MQPFAALLVSAILASGISAPAPRHAAAIDPAAEVYVAELDADWNVAREIRLPCDPERGCAAELGGALKVHVRFEAVRHGAVAVSSSVEDAAGRATPQPPVTVTLDRTGFGAAHVTAPGPDGHVLMMAVRAPRFAGIIDAPAPAAPI